MGPSSALVSRREPAPERRRPLRSVRDPDDRLHVPLPERRRVGLELSRRHVGGREDSRQAMNPPAVRAHPRRWRVAVALAAVGVGALVAAATLDARRSQMRAQTAAAADLAQAMADVGQARQEWQRHLDELTDGPPGCTPRGIWVAPRRAERGVPREPPLSCVRCGDVWRCH